MRDFRVINATMPTATTLGSALDLGASYRNVYLQIPTMATSTLIKIHSAESLAGTYLPIMQRLNPATLTSYVPDPFQFITAVCAGVHPIPEGLRFIKLELKTMVSNNATAFNLICSND